MLKPTLVSTIALSLALTLACQPAEEPAEGPAEEQEAVEETETAAPPDEIVGTIGGDWIVRAPSGRACVSVPPSAIPGGQTLDVEIKILPPPIPPAFDQASQAFPPVYNFSVRDQDGDPTQFADSVVFAICVNYGSASKPDSMRIARASSESSLEYLREVPVPPACHLRCGGPEPAQSAAWLEPLFGGSPFTATPASAALEQEGLGGKGRTTSPFAGVEKPPGAAGN